MGKKKGNKDEENGDVEEVVEENATSLAKDTGKKAKKGRKKKDEDWEDEVTKELENLTMEEGGEKEAEPEQEAVPEKKEKKKEKKSKKSKTEDSESEEELQGKPKRGRGFTALMDVGSDDDDDSDEAVMEDKKEKKNKKQEKPAKKSSGFAALMDEDSDDLNNQDMDEADTDVKKDKQKNKKQEKPAKKGGGFAALMDEGGDDLHDDDDMDEPVIEEKRDKDKNKKPEKLVTPAGGKNDKKKGKKGKKQKNDEEDLDQILAELEMEYKGEKPKEEPKKEETKVVEEAPQASEESGKKKKKQKKKEASVEPETEETPAEVVEKEAVQEPSKDTEAEEAKEKKEDGGTQEDANKAKKKKKKKAKDGKEDIAEQPEVSIEVSTAPEEQSVKVAEADEDGKKKKKGKDTEDDKKKKGKDTEDDKKKKGKDTEDDKARKGKPSKKALAAMKEILAKQKEEEERLRQEEEERQRIEEEELRRIEEEKRIEQEKRERKKQKEKERKERLKAEGKLLTPKQKAEQKRAQEMLEHLKAIGATIPGAGERRPRPGTRIKPKKPKKDENTENQAPEDGEVQKTDVKVEETPMEVESPAGEEVKEEEEEEEVKDAWDESSSDDEEEEEEDTSEATKTSQDTETKKKNSKKAEDDDADEESEDDEDEEEEESEPEVLSEEHMKEAEKRRQRAIDRLIKRKEENLKNLDADTLRAPVVCVLGHVDHGKTKILDKLRKTNVQEGEVGGITQQIGATNVPADAVKRQTHMVKDFDMESLKFPGLLIIDTPGHESFRNLRSRGSSLCDIAILVVDITQGLEPQTRESISLLRKKGTPFVVALNKVDRIYEWDSHPSKDIRDIIHLQSEPSKNDFERRTSQIIQGLREEKLNSALFWENPNPKEYISLVPTSAISGDGMGNLISLICSLCQQRLKKTLIFSEELQCTVLEVKTIQGHGTTIDVILVNGRLREGDTIVVAGTEGPIVTQIRSLLLPKPLKEIRVKGQYDEFKEVAAAQGVKIAARDLEKAIAGLSLKVAYHEDEIDIMREIVDKEFKSAMRSIKVKDRGVYVQASTLGALEALLEFFKTNDVPYSGIRVGPVVKRDVMRAAAMLEHDPMYAVILAFDVKVEKDAQELADKEGVKIFFEETIYHLGDRYVEYLKDYKKKKQDEFRGVAVFPSRLKIIPTAIFNKRDPIVLGVTVESGILRTGTPLCVPSKEFVEIGIVTSMEFDHKNVDIAKKGVDVCIKIEPVPGHTPKLFGRHFEAEDILVSKISRESINACKDHFRDDLSKTDWKLMADLKKQFQIL